MPQPSPKLLDQVREALRRKHYAWRTEQSYLAWIKRYILFHHKRHNPKSGFECAPIPVSRIKPAGKAGPLLFGSNLSTDCIVR
jgi:hypothetical protein